MGYVGSTLEYIVSILGYVGYFGSRLGYVESFLACNASASVFVNTRSDFGYFEST